MVEFFPRCRPRWAARRRHMGIRSIGLVWFTSICPDFMWKKWYVDYAMRRYHDDTSILYAIGSNRLQHFYSLSINEIIIMSQTTLHVIYKSNVMYVVILPLLRLHWYSELATASGMPRWRGYPYDFGRECRCTYPKPREGETWQEHCLRRCLVADKSWRI